VNGKEWKRGVLEIMDRSILGCKKTRKGVRVRLRQADNFPEKRRKKNLMWKIEGEAD